MLAGRGFATAAVLLLIALSYAAIARRLERERRLVARLRARGAVDAAHALALDALGDAEREAVDSLRAAGVVAVSRDRCHLVAPALAPYRRRRVRLALTGTLAAILLAAIFLAFILAR
ncbi:MAG: hypothetical protein CMLOHMNK_02842 [Steroidobacteraceae bacterium]|nr:hypothetical protein [Steroidobacteraceae bacterium]